ncbi:MAG: HDOD domain-containing protein [Pseudomonadota bacterium]
MIQQESMAFLTALSTELNRGEVKLPSFPDAVIKIRDALERDDCDIDKIATLASVETVLATRLLKAANSAFYNPSGNAVSDLRGAVMRLGLKEVRNMAISFAVEQIFISEKLPGIEQSLATLWRRGVAMSSIAYVVAKECSDVDPEKAFLAGLMHEVGKLYMLIKSGDFPGVDVDLDARSDDPDTWHPQIGRFIVEAWGFDDELLDTLQPSDGLEDQPPGGRATMLDVIYASELAACSTPEIGIDFSLPSFGRLELTLDRLKELQPVIRERMDSMVESLAQ